MAKDFDIHDLKESQSKTALLLGNLCSGEQWAKPALALSQRGSSSFIVGRTKDFKYLSSEAWDHPEEKPALSQNKDAQRLG